MFKCLWAQFQVSLNTIEGKKANSNFSLLKPILIDRFNRWLGERVGIWCMVDCIHIQKKDAFAKICFYRRNSIAFLSPRHIDQYLIIKGTIYLHK